MTGKRFEIVAPKNEWVGFDILDNKTGKKYYGGRLAQCIELCDFLNENEMEMKVYANFISKVLKILMKYNIHSLKKLDKVLFYERNW